MAALSRGAQHYILQLIPSLLNDIGRLGLKQVIARSDLGERDITSLYFEVKSIAQLLPDDPLQVDPAIWGELVHCIRLMQLLINEAAGDDLVRARRRAINKFLPRARQCLKSEFEKRRQQGNVDFRLAGIVRTQMGGERAEETCMEALRLERQRRFDSAMTIAIVGLNWHQAVIVQDAKTCVRQQMASPPDDFGVVDLLVSLMDLLRVMLDRESAGKPPDVEVETVVLSLGNMLYRQELGLDRQAHAQSQQVG
ncbi:hypothetical protein RE428_42760 [Marinobacter nanhaiticus D15-8W]|uniref:Uncharacterized protein n=1 Tax=Marinobacter nanhaiticus D15-8W TaxID=626887 RepID=N6W6K0_9GAMM|nr:hypothetical protein [Marinobacter nanhaiticus]ENO15884.1 hypothetical protein J057_11046 [Marinobacter nanhaiticus D15-8W]BES73258.1 hypothetical protein RE428_42760 [Marinobacter nanhaiticus D15-8W]